MKCAPEDAKGRSPTDGEEAQLIARRVEQRHRLFGRAIERAGVDHADAADATVFPNVRVTDEQVVVLLVRQYAPHKLRVVAVRDGDAFSRQIELAERVEALDLQG